MFLCFLFVKQCFNIYGLLGERVRLQTLNIGWTIEQRCFPVDAQIIQRYATTMVWSVDGPVQSASHPVDSQTSPTAFRCSQCRQRRLKRFTERMRLGFRKLNFRVKEAKHNMSWYWIFRSQDFTMDGTHTGCVGNFLQMRRARGRRMAFPVGYRSSAPVRVWGTSPQKLKQNVKLV